MRRVDLRGEHNRASRRLYRDHLGERTVCFQQVNRVRREVRVRDGDLSPRCAEYVCKPAGERSQQNRRGPMEVDTVHRRLGALEPGAEVDLLAVG